MSGKNQSFRKTHKGRKKTFKKVKKSTKSIRNNKRKKVKTTRRYRKDQKLYRRNRIKSTRKTKRSRKDKKVLKGGSGAASEWLSSLNNSETASCPPGKIEVPWLDQAGITPPKHGVNPQGIQASLTSTFRQASENRSMDSDIGK